MSRTFSILLFAGLLAFSGCRTASLGFEYGVTIPEVDLQISKVTIEDGIDAEEAELLAKIYFNRRFGNCGMLTTMDANPQSWNFRCIVGIAGTDRGIIHVDKATGRITCTAGPTVEDFHELAMIYGIKH